MLLQPSSDSAWSVSRDDATRDLKTAKASELYAAIHEGNVGVIQTILSSPDASDIAAVSDAQGENALFHAIEKRDLLTMEYLLRLPSGPALALQRSHRGLIALNVAVAKGSVVAVKQLLALSSASAQIAASLLQAPMQAIPHPLMDAVYRGQEGVVRALLESPHAAPLVAGRDALRSNALLIVAASGHIGMVHAMLESNYAGALAQDSNHLGFNALMAAAVNGHENVVQALLESPHATGLVQGRNHSGCNALMLAALVGHKRMVKALLDYGFVPQQLHTGGSPVSALDFALARGHLSVADLLRRHGAVRAMNGISSSSSVSMNLPYQ